MCSNQFKVRKLKASVSLGEKEKVCMNVCKTERHGRQVGKKNRPEEGITGIFAAANNRVMTWKNQFIQLHFNTLS